MQLENSVSDGDSTIQTSESLRDDDSDKPLGDQEHDPFVTKGSMNKTQSMPNLHNQEKPILPLIK